jgi:hypothetical protein
MIRLATMTAGIASAGLAAAVETSVAAPVSLTLLWSGVAGIAGAAMTYGILTNKVNAAHARITAEKCDREKAVADLKFDVNHGFDRIEQRLTDQTSTVIAALRDLGGK